jgi:hypothetical protein
MLVAGLAQAGGTVLPQGSYAGSAEWQGPSRSSGTYTVERTFKGDTIEARYAWRDKEPREERHTVTFAFKPTEPTFDVVDESGTVVGRGHCFKDACAYRATFGPVEVEETFHWSGTDLGVLGAKSGPGFSVVWNEKLESK